MLAQDQQPNLFFRDFFVDGFLTLGALLQAALPTYDINSLNILTSQLDVQTLLENDVTTQIGQKFIATTNNIQKITLLLSVQDLDVGQETNLVWTGDLIVSIYPLQSTTDCINDIAPTTPIDFSPSNIPLAQISIDYSTLLASGVVLDSVPQPIDFVFSNSASATGNTLVVGNYYALTIKRAGSANMCDILISIGSDLVPNSRITTFTGTLWVDIPEQDLWFQIWSDAAKVSDGQAYDDGHGVIIPKTMLDNSTQTTTDYSLDSLSFTGTDVFSAHLSAITQESVPVPDQRTGNPVLSRQQFVPSVELLDTIDLTNLENTSEPLLLGVISDKNIKFSDTLSSLINSKLYSATIINDELLIRIVDDPTDVVRFDTSVSSLATDLLNGDFVGAQIVPDANFPNESYRIASAKLCSMIVGDVDGDGVITSNDFDLLNSYLNYNLNVSLPQNTTITTNSITTTFTNGYTTYLKPFMNVFGISFQLVDPNTNLVVASAPDGALVANPNDPRLGQFTSATVNFSAIIGVSSLQLIILSGVNPTNHGGFNITSLDTVHNALTIQKVILTGDVFAEMFRADIDGDFVITGNDGYLLNSYIEKVVLSNSPPSPFPGPTSNAYAKIGSPFTIIRFRLERFVDRTDDYSSTLTAGRSTAIHIAPDIFTDDGYLASHNFYASPIPIAIEKQLIWDESLVVSNTSSKLVPAIFSTINGFTQNSCTIDGITCNVYPVSPEFDPGRVDYYVPNNLIIGNGGELQRPDGTFYKVDFETGTIVLEIPDGLFNNTEQTLSLMDDFIIDYTGTGITRLGFPALRFADCSTVSANALVNNQIRFSVSVQSFSPNTNGLSQDGYSGIIVDGKMGVSINYDTGLLTLNFSNLYQDEILQTLSTKVQITVFLKKAGFNNLPLFVDSTKVGNLLQLTNVFSGANDGIAAGVEYDPATPADWAGTPPATVSEALDRMAALLNTHYGPIP